MDVDEDRIDEAVLALHDGARAWKGHDWDALDRLHRKGFILNPASEARSVVLTEEGLHEAERLFEVLFARRPAHQQAELPEALDARAPGCRGGGPRQRRVSHAEGNGCHPEWPFSDSSPRLTREGLAGQQTRTIRADAVDQEQSGSACMARA